MRYLVVTFVALSLVGSASAQQSAPSPDQTQAPAAAPAESPPDPAMARPGTANRQPNPMRAACMDKARQQGLRGQQLRDTVQLCMQETRLSCTKQAIDKNIPAQQRRDFIRNCTG